MNKKLYIAGLAALTLSAQAMYEMEFDARMEKAMILSVQDGYYPGTQQQKDVEGGDMLAAIIASLQDATAWLRNVDKKEVDDEYEKAIALSKKEHHEKIQEENDINCLNDDLLNQIEGEGSVYDVMRLIAKGAQINVRYSDSLTPLMVAARENRPVICSLLIGSGAQINTEDNKGDTPLDYAIGTNNSKLCKFFVERGADLNPTSDYTEISLLGRALLRQCDFMLYKNLSNRGAKL